MPANPVTPREAEERLACRVEQGDGMTLAERRLAAELIRDAIPRERRAAYDAAMKCAEIAESTPIDEARCKVLMLTSQAWEEGQDSAAAAIRAYAASLLEGRETPAGHPLTDGDLATQREINDKARR